MRRLLFAVAVLLGSMAGVGSAGADPATDPSSPRGVEQQLVVQVPEHATPPVPIAIGADAPVVGPAPSAGSLPRTGVGPWFGPTLVVALLLLGGGLVLRSGARRLAPQRMAWPQYGQVA